MTTVKCQAFLCSAKSISREGRMSTVPARPAVTGQTLVLDNVDWRMYSRLLYIFAERRTLRLTYDRGCLEIMSPLHEHESVADFLACLVVVLTEELGLPRKAGGATTLRRRRMRRGLEPDRCYWIAHEPVVRGKRRINLRIDPPPDLAIEVDVTHSSLDRMSIYATLRVPEVWRIDEQTLTFHVLGTRSYHIQTHSLAFPMVTPADLMNFVALCTSQEENSVVRQFRAWVQQQLSAGRGTPPPP
jgi:Uma2 family endonuclease